MIKVNIGGVPEHFNFAWYLTLKNGEYKKEGINLRWHDYYGGTGDMCKGLRSGELDIAVILTEGIIKDIIAGNPSKIVQTFVSTPLVWGIHVSNESRFQTIEELKGTIAAISRFGSGSHLMAFVNAEQYNWHQHEDLHFKVVENLSGAIEGLTNGEADYFMWEKFTTKPLVDNGTFRRIGDCPSPWPCFVIAVREEFIRNKNRELQTILKIINNTTINFKSTPFIGETIADRYDIKLNDVLEWLSITEWSQSIIDQQTVKIIQEKLQKLDIIPKKAKYSELITIL